MVQALYKSTEITAGVKWIPYFNLLCPSLNPSGRVTIHRVFIGICANLSQLYRSFAERLWLALSLLAVAVCVYLEFCFAESLRPGLDGTGVSSRGCFYYFFDLFKDPDRELNITRDSVSQGVYFSLYLFIFCWLKNNHWGLFKEGSPRAASHSISVLPCQLSPLSPLILCLQFILQFGTCIVLPEFQSYKQGHFLSCNSLTPLQRWSH